MKMNSRTTVISTKKNKHLKIKVLNKSSLTIILEIKNVALQHPESHFAYSESNIKSKPMILQLLSIVFDYLKFSVKFIYKN